MQASRKVNKLASALTDVGGEHIILRDAFVSTVLQNVLADPIAVDWPV
jgi:hypothetical protein